MAIEWRRWGLGLLGLALCLGTPSRDALAQTEIEPNNSCADARDILQGSRPTQGSIDLPDVDYYRYVGTPGQTVIIEMTTGTNPNSLLRDLRLGVFGGSSCEFQLAVVQGYERTRAVVGIPAEGFIVIAAASQGDYYFNGSGWYSGSYQLSVSVPLRAIRGRLIDATTQAAIPGDRKPFGSVSLLHCQPECSPVAQTAASSSGEFEFSGGQNLLAGNYQMQASAEEYETTLTDLFYVAADETFDAGELELVPPPIVFANGRPCRVLPQGGVCTYSVRIANNTEEPLEGLAWSVVVGSFPNVEGVGFEATSAATASETTVKRPAVNIAARSSEEVSFRFALPSFAPNGSHLCVSLFLGLKPFPLANPARGEGNLFCITKGPRGFRLLDERESHRAFQELRGER